MIELTPEKEQEVIDFYLVPNSLNETVRVFGFSNRYQIQKILKRARNPRA